MCVYGEPQANQREACWIAFSVALARLRNATTCIRDWNCIWDYADKRGGRLVPFSHIELGQRILNDCHLMDIGFQWPKYTWSKVVRDETLMEERLNRAAANCQWSLLFPSAYLENMIASGSDHLPIFLSSTQKGKWRPRPFRFEWMWTLHPQCLSLIKENWTKEENSGQPKILNKIESLVPSLKTWNRE